MGLAMLIGGIILLLAGVLTYILGRRGFTVGNHIFCAGCNFDLRGLPEGHARCPECGAYILRDGAVRIGYRRPVLAGMVIGAFVCLPGAGLLAAATFAWWPTFDASWLKPQAMLRRQMDAPR